MDEPPDITLPPGTNEPPAKYYVKGKPVSVLTERVEYLDENGKLVTESLRDYSRKAIRRHFTSLDQFLRRWKSTERKEAIIEELAEEGLLLEPLLEEVGKDLDPFDQPLSTRRKRVNNVKNAMFSTNMACKPVPCLKLCSPNIKTKALSPVSTTSRFWKSTHSTRWEPPFSLSRNSAPEPALKMLSTNCNPPFIRTLHD